MAPEVPVTVMVAAPRCAELAADRLSVADVVAVAGLKAAVTPVGKPEMVSETVEAKPACGEMVTTATAEPPA